jgi:four helix bundle protein
MANIAEGFECGSDAEFARFLSIAKASAGEVESHLYVAIDRGYLTEAAAAELRLRVAATRQLVAGLIWYLRQHPKDRPPGRAARRHR